MPADVQDALITILSEKTLPVPELGDRGAGRARGSTSSPPPTTATAASTSCPARCAAGSTPSCCRCRPSAEEEVEIVARRVAQLGRALELPDVPAALDEIRRVVTVFRELRVRRDRGRPDQAQVAVRHAVDRRGDLGGHQRPGAGRALRRRRAARRPTWPPASSARSSRTRSPTAVVWPEYLETVVRERDGWRDFYRACREISRVTVSLLGDPPPRARVGPGGARRARPSCSRTWS